MSIKSTIEGLLSNNNLPTDNILSYASILNDRKKFRTSGTRHGSDFNIFDTPSNKYFKILFYFAGRSMFETDEFAASGLLAPTWKYMGDAINNGNSDKLTHGWYGYNSAYAYLKLNDENERAEKLQQFITLLSNINSESPWYFNSISGLDSAIERKVATDGKLDLSEVKRLQIKCIPDAVDDRIGTLLSLYRDIVWSWTMKREILPSNMRKFDMAVYVFEAPVKYIHKETDVIDGISGFKPSYRMYEFHNCEFDYNSIKSGYSEIDNKAGTQPTYTIDIMYDDCYEVSYNSIMMRTIGDVIKTDTATACMSDDGTPVYNISSTEQFDDYNQQEELINRVNESETNFAEQIVGAVKGDVVSLVKRAVLGNIYSYSLTKIGSDLDSLAQGNLIKAGQTAKDYIKTAQERAAMRNKGNVKPSGDIYPDNPTIKLKPSRNIFNKATIANNI